ncbi:hypothetical protein [Methylomicrobium sp. Wu6]|uniref:hypothetical protein n=1 Tax=Methylomicrobium sp. Wu6 TaxID=3107928 RepID=UPI002DD64067|nr:hypothetical protein [Methylomicrobium sp. Wu6]MEC4747288.1 hypothetical protein [Methylomicrobium sp. Wu6]
MADLLSKLYILGGDGGNAGRQMMLVALNHKFLNLSNWIFYEVGILYINQWVIGVFAKKISRLPPRNNIPPYL